MYDPMDIESIVKHNKDEEEDYDAGDAGFMRGYLGMDGAEAI